MNTQTQPEPYDALFPEKIAERISKLSYKIINLLRQDTAEIPDLEQEFRLALIQAHADWESSLSSWKTFANMIITNTRRRIFESLKTHAGKGLLSLTNTYPKIERLDPAEMRRFPTPFYQALTTILAQLSPEDNQIAQWTMQGISKREMARRLNMERNWFFRHRWPAFCDTFRTALKTFVNP